MNDVEPGPHDRGGATVVRRAMAILDVVLTSATPPTLTEIIHATGLPKSTVYRLLKLLNSDRLVQRSGYRYGPGEAALRLTVDHALPVMLRHILLPYVVRLHHLTGHVSFLCIAALEDVVVAEVVFEPGQEQKAPIRGTRLAAYRTAGGKVLMAYDHAFADRVLAGDSLALAGGHASVDPVALITELQQIRESGLARTDGGWADGVHERAVLIYGVGRPIAGLSIARPGPFPQDPLLSRTLRHVAHQASLAARRVAAG